MSGNVRALMWDDRSTRSVQINRLLTERRRHAHQAILETHPVTPLRIKPVEHLSLKHVPYLVLREVGILRELPAVEQGYVMAPVDSAFHRGTESATSSVELSKSLRGPDSMRRLRGAI
jgi:hypothetical protein